MHCKIKEVVKDQCLRLSMSRGGGGGGDSYIRGDRGAVSEGMLMDQTIRENMSKNRPKIPGKCRQCNQYDRVK